MKGKAALSHTRRTLLTTRSLSSSPRTVRCQLSYHPRPSTRLEPSPMSLASVRALSPSCHARGYVLAGSQLLTQLQLQTDQTWTQRLRERSPPLHERTTDANEVLRARLKFTSPQFGSIVPLRFNTWIMSNPHSWRAPVPMATMLGTCPERHPVEHLSIN